VVDFARLKAVAAKLHSRLQSMVYGAHCAKHAEHQQEKCPTANNQGQQHGDYCTAGVRFMSTG